MSTSLVVDDSLFARKVLSDILEQAGIQVVSKACDGEEAYEMYKLWHPDVVLMDITMPHVNGIEGVERIMKEFPEAKIIMCSAMGQQSLITKSILLGAKDFIVKPYKKEYLLGVVLRVLNA